MLRQTKYPHIAVPGVNSSAARGAPHFWYLSSGRFGGGRGLRRSERLRNRPI